MVIGLGDWAWILELGDPGAPQRAFPGLPGRDGEALGTSHSCPGASWPEHPPPWDIPEAEDGLGPMALYSGWHRSLWLGTGPPPKMPALQDQLRQAENLDGASARATPSGASSPKGHVPQWSPP